MVADGEGQVPPEKVHRPASVCSGREAEAARRQPSVQPASALTDLPPLLILALCVASFSFVLPCLFGGFFFFCFDGGCTFSSGSVKAVWLSWVTEHFAGDVSGRHWSGPVSTFILIHLANGAQWRPTGTDPRPFELFCFLFRSLGRSGLNSLPARRRMSSFTAQTGRRAAKDEHF